MSIHWIHLFVLLDVVTLGLCRKTLETCLTSAAQSHLTLTCKKNEMIHVLNKQYQQADQACLVVFQGCAILSHSFETGLFATCNGHQTCDETVNNFALRTGCVNTLEATIATVTYECLSGGEDICSPFTNSWDNVLSLMTPDFPKPGVHPGFCTCEVTGAPMSVEILTVIFPGFPQTGVSLNLTGDDSTVSFGPYAFNHAVFGKTVDSLKLDFDGKRLSSQHFWLKLVGPSSINVTCNRDALTTTVPTTLETSTLHSQPASTQATVTGSSSSVDSSSTVSVTAPTNTSGTHTGPADGKPNIIPIVIGSVLGFLVVVVIVIVIVFIVYRRRGPKKLYGSRDQLYESRNGGPHSDVKVNGGGVEMPAYVLDHPDVKDDLESHGTSQTCKLDFDVDLDPCYATTDSFRPNNVTPTSHSGTPEIVVFQDPGYAKLDTVKPQKQSAPDNVRRGFLKPPVPSKPIALDSSGSSKKHTGYVNVRIDTCPSDPNESASGHSGDDPPGNTLKLPYTTKKLEEIYAKVIPKKLRSLRDKHKRNSRTSNNEEDKTVGSESNVDKNVSLDTETQKKQKGKDKVRTLSEPDYAEIDETEEDIEASGNPERVPPPVPPKLFTDDKSPEPSSKQSKVQKSKKAKKNSKDKKSKTSKKGLKTVKTSAQKVELESTPDSVPSNVEPMVMVDNVAYHSGPVSLDKPVSASPEEMVMIDNIIYNSYPGGADSVPSHDPRSSEEKGGNSSSGRNQRLSSHTYEIIRDEDVLNGKPYLVLDKSEDFPNEIII